MSKDHTTTLGIDGLGSTYPLRQSPTSSDFAVLIDGQLATVSLFPRAAQLDEVRFYSDCEQLAAVSSHPHILELTRFGFSSQNEPYAVHPFCEGSAADLLDQTGPLLWPDALRVMVALCDALGHAHAARLVHGSLSPDKIMIDDQGKPLVARFPLPSIDAISPRPDEAPSGFDAPERIAGQHNSPAADVFSTAAIGLALMGQPQVYQPPPLSPREAIGHMTSRSSRLHARFGSLELPGRLRAILEMALLEDPTQRPTAIEFRDGLRAIYDNERPPLAAPAVPSGTIGAQRIRDALDTGSESPRRRFATAGVIGAALIIALAGLLLFGGSKDTARDSDVESDREEQIRSELTLGLHESDPDDVDTEVRGESTATVTETANLLIPTAVPAAAAEPASPETSPDPGLDVTEASSELTPSQEASPVATPESTSTATPSPQPESIPAQDPPDLEDLAIVTPTPSSATATLSISCLAGSMHVSYTIANLGTSDVRYFIDSDDGALKESLKVPPGGHQPGRVSLAPISDLTKVTITADNLVIVEASPPPECASGS